MSLISNALSLENEYTNVTLESADADLALEQAAGEIEVADRSVERAQMEQEELEVAAGTMEEICVSLESAATEEVGLTRGEAAAHRIAIRQALRGALPMPIASLESFGEEGERVDATVLSLEGVKETVMKIWNAIKRAVGNAIRAVADFFSKLFGGVKKLREKAEAVLKKIKEKKTAGETLEGDKITSARGLDRIHYKGDTSMKAIADGMKVISGEVAGTINDINDNAVDTYNAIAKMIKDRKEDEKALQTAAMSTGYNKMITNAKFIGQPLPGGKQMQTTGNVDSDNEDAAIPKIKFIDTPKDKTPKITEVAGVTLDAMDSLMTGTIAVLKKMEDAKKGRDALKKSREDVVKQTEDLAKDAEKLVEKVGGWWTQARINAALRSANMDFNTMISRCDNYIFSYSRGLVQFCDHAVGEFKAKKA